MNGRHKNLKPNKTGGEYAAGTSPVAGILKRNQAGFAALVALFVFMILLYAVITDKAAVFDDPIRELFYNLRTDWLTPFVRGLTYLGNWQTIVILCLVLLAIKPTRFFYGIPVSAGAIFVTVLNKTLKGLVGRLRPDDIMHLVSEGGFSFPSGHSITSMFVYGMLIYLIRINVKNKRRADILTSVLIIPMIGIGLSRIYLGVHYPTDVLAGWCLGIINIIIIADIIKKNRQQ